MNFKYLFSIVSVIAISLGSSATAQQLPASVFPETIQECIDRGDCTTPVRDGFISILTPLVEQYRYTETSFNGAITNEMFLLRYSLGAGSDFQSQVNNVFGEPSFTDAVFFGEAWLSVRESYELGSSFQTFQPVHPVTLHTDQIVGGDNIVFGSPNFGPDINLLISDEALLAGGGSFTEEVTGLVSGNISADLNIDFCLSEGCFVGAELNLVGLSYEQIGNSAVLSSFPQFTDPNGQLLFSQTSGFPGFNGTSDSFFNHQTSLVIGEAVPEPGTGVVQVLAVLCALSARRRVRQSA